MPKNILVGYDGSETARRAFLFALELARCSGARVRVVSVIQIAEGGPDVTTLMMSDTSAKRVRELLGELKSLEPDAESLVDLEVVYGSPGDALLTQVLQNGIDHIVIGHTDRGALARWLVGSVSTDVLAKAHVPVTVVR
ncbi:nucleotide-binding universal stress UspA family protein [Luteibacter rhizovicinus]|uniref:Nucleotide-binding universal stress UspA family protein n=1 Tax=Luteibacter rhizovicinus TaxID=242606 RepID=A0A4R3YIM0_9GAMM|nr:universal stress protein [Luteibacter rhizovicinus]TCV92040.1 nucleotide-binding universal stress UspA family protein [Luteibacter rhizovicinus]